MKNVKKEIISHLNGEMMLTAMAMSCGVVMRREHGQKRKQ
jgi:hypothetical protein